MNTFDIVIICILGFCLIRGVFRGLIKGLFSLIGSFAALYGAYTFYPNVSRLMAGWFTDDYLKIISFMLLFCAIFIVINLIGVLLKYLLKIASFGWLDRICGAGVGFIVGILIVSVLLFVFTTFLPKGTMIVQESKLAPWVSHISKTIVAIVPPDLGQQFDKNLKGLKEFWNTHRKKMKENVI